MHHTHGVAGSSPVVSIFSKNIIISIRPHGQAVKTTPSHGVNSGSIPDEVIKSGNIEVIDDFRFFLCMH